MEQLKFLEILFILVDTIVIPWGVWATLQIFSKRQAIALLQQKIQFLETNIVNDIAAIRKDIQESRVAATKAAEEAIASNEKLDKKMDLFMANEINVLKGMIASKSVDQ